MDILKKQNFSRTYPGVDFPVIKALRTDRVSDMRASLTKKLGLPAEVDGLRLMRKLESVSSLLEQIDATDPQFSLEKILKSQSVSAQEAAMLNWYRFDSLDEMKLAELDKFFTDVWYPGSDDLDVFDVSMTWVLSIAHNGQVKLARL